MTWLLTSTGREHHLSGGRALMPTNVPNIGEIAHSLSMINRFTGHCSRPYSVAEHSILVLDIARTMTDDPNVLMAALMHDAHECITGDVASPVKQVLGELWAEFEEMQQARLLAKHNLLRVTLDAKDLIKRCDLIALATERRDLMPFDARVHAPWPILDTPGKLVHPWDQVNLNSTPRRLINWVTWSFRFDMEARHLQDLRMGAMEAARA